MVSTHYINDRQAREHLIRKIGQGRIVDTFIVDKGHPNGPERHEVSDTGIVVIYNLRTGKLITKLIARPNQIKRYYEAEHRVAPEDILKIAYEHTLKNYNN